MRPVIWFDSEASGHQYPEVSRTNPFPVQAVTADDGLRIVETALTLDASGAYADGDTLADIVEITNAVRESGGNAILDEISVLDEDDQGQGFDIILFKQTVAVGTKNAAWAVSDANMRNYLGLVRIQAPDYVDLGGNRLATKSRLGIGIQPAATSLFLGTISRGTGTYTANGLRLKITIRR